MARTDDDFVRILRPFRIISPFSITMATANRYNESAMYLAYAVLTLVPPTAIGWHHILARENNTCILFNAGGITFTYWTLNFMLNVYLIATLRKRRIQKLILEMQKLDELLRFSNEAHVKMMIIHNKIWLASNIAFYVSIAIYVAYSYTLNNSSSINGLILFVIVDVAMISEVACFSCFTVLLNTRINHFVLHLKSLLAGTRRDKGTDVTSCYRQMHRVLQKLVKACQVQMAAVICFSCYSCLRILLAFIQISNTIESICLNVLTLARYTGVLVAVGALGHTLGSHLVDVGRLALLMEYSSNGELRSAGRCLRSEAAVRARGLTLLGAPLTARLPLHAASALAAALILLLQLGVKLTY